MGCSEGWSEFLRLTGCGFEQQGTDYFSLPDFLQFPPCQWLQQLSTISACVVISVGENKASLGESEGPTVHSLGVETRL